MYVGSVVYLTDVDGLVPRMLPIPLGPFGRQGEGLREGHAYLKFTIPFFSPIFFISSLTWYRLTGTLFC